MKIKQKANLITSILNKQYPETPVPLNHNDNYTLLIAVLLSAQCTDKRVNEVTPHLFNIANDPLSMSKLSEKKIYSIIKPCGLGPKKSKAIKLLSKILVKNYGGEVPENLNALENLPGVGHKTASVVISQGFGHPAFPVDTHIHRLAQRWKLTNGKNVTQTEKDLKRVFPEESWNKLHLQIIFWGREFCQAHECFALECKICKTINPKRIRPFAHKRP
jgi:endonuclease-3